VFDETGQEAPKEDWVAAATPDISALPAAFRPHSAYAGSELTYYHEYESERSVGYSFRGRFDFLLSRMRPFVGGGRLETRTRPNGEIDTAPTARKTSCRADWRSTSRRTRSCMGPRRSATPHMRTPSRTASISASR
jgi:hypothetical protein